MKLHNLLEPLLADPGVSSLATGESSLVVVGEPARAGALAAAAGDGGEVMLVVVATAAEAGRLTHDLGAYLSADQVEEFPAWETLPFERVSPSTVTMARRVRVRWRLASGDAQLRFVVTSVKALAQRLGPWSEAYAPIQVAAHGNIDQEELIRQLVQLGYRREYQVEHRGEFSVRGSIVDVFGACDELPVRIDLWGEEVERLTQISVADQRSIADIESATLWAARELLVDHQVGERAASLMQVEPWAAEMFSRLAEKQSFDGMESWLPWLVGSDELLSDLIPPSGRVVFCEPRRLRDRASEVVADEEALVESLSSTWSRKSNDETPRLHLDFDRLMAKTQAADVSILSVGDQPMTPEVTISDWGGGGGDPEAIAQYVGSLLRDDFDVVICADTENSARRMTQSLVDNGVEANVVEQPVTGAKAVSICVQPYESGCVFRGANLAVFSESDITGRRRAHRQPAISHRKSSDTFFDDLKPGDHVVHHQHGVARYEGMVKRSIGGVERDYLLLAYRGDDRLYVPSDQVDGIRPYSGGETPSLSRFGGSDWSKTKARVRAATREVAQELVVLYQRRAVSQGISFGPDTPWQRQMEEDFPYVETPDQLTAIAAVKEDMETERPMDRLLCGDVGFGKTEVALRAVFKAVQAGKQAAVLVPTTLLAQQHFLTFSERFSGFPVNVQVLSRFLTTKQANHVVKGLAEGNVDVVIGTHRLLGEDVSFKDLGLLVVDEEQRFGVSHKEKIKKLRTNVDVLTLSATPIPRTLELSLTGLRDLSLLNTPPADRQPILTYVGEYDERAVAEALRRELLREGQVFYIHNRVRTIEQAAQRLRELVPEARIAIAHGQMDEGTLETVVLDYWHGAYDVLVCTTIIESGIDMPTVNTLVVERADLLGLGQLHQIRGRVGRAGQRAYAYLFYPPDVRLTEEAYERLRTIGEHTQLGSGFKIAMRDLQIRGAGNLLGSSQSGHIAAVGYDLYVQMIQEAVAELKGEEIRIPAEIKLDLPVDAHLPSIYIPHEDLRLDAYRRLATVTTHDEVDDIAAEWVDRFGQPPAPAAALLDIARLRAECVAQGITQITVATPGGGMSRPIARISPISLPTSKQIRLQRTQMGALYKEDVGELQVVVSPGGELPMSIVGLLRDLTS